MRPSGAVRTSQTPQLGSASPSVICGCCPHPRAPGALALSLDRERDRKWTSRGSKKFIDSEDDSFTRIKAFAGRHTKRTLLKPVNDRVSPHSRKRSSELHLPELPRSPFRLSCASWARSNPYAGSLTPTCNCSTRKTYMLPDQQDHPGR